MHYFQKKSCIACRREARFCFTRYVCEWRIYAPQTILSFIQIMACCIIPNAVALFQCCCIIPMLLRYSIAGIFSIEPNLSEIGMKIQPFLFKKMNLKMLSAKWQPFCLSLNVLIWHTNFISMWDGASLLHVNMVITISFAIISMLSWIAAYSLFNCPCLETKSKKINSSTPGQND